MRSPRSARIDFEHRGDAVETTKSAVAFCQRGKILRGQRVGWRAASRDFVEIEKVAPRYVRHMSAGVANAERERSENRLRQFVADASHELRTPLTSVRGYAELFRRGASDRPEDLRVVMRRIEDDAARMGVLVEDMLLLARLDQEQLAEPEPVDLGGIAADLADDARMLHQTGPWSCGWTARPP